MVEPTHAWFCQPSLIHTQHLKQERQYGAATYIIERGSFLTHTKHPMNGTSNVLDSRNPLLLFHLHRGNIIKLKQKNRQN